jgi:hypothetical protein
MQITEHFTLAELTRSQIAARRGIINQPNPRQKANLRRLCESVLEPLREALARPVHVNSGFRCRKLNAAIGGSPRSAHMDGCAGDITVPGMTSREVAKAIASLDLPIDTLIMEFDQWVHVAVAKDGKPRDRHLIARYDRATGESEYIPTRFC